MPMIDTGVIEEMFTSDIAFLQELYRRKNSPPEGELGEGNCLCPACGEQFPLPVTAAEPEGVLLGSGLGE
jgi:hypothetical protein